MDLVKDSIEAGRGAGSAVLGLFLWPVIFSALWLAFDAAGFAYSFFPLPYAFAFFSPFAVAFAVLKYWRGNPLSARGLYFGMAVAAAFFFLYSPFCMMGCVKIVNMPSLTKDTLSNGLREIQSRGYGVTTPDKVWFSEGQMVAVGELIADIPIQKRDVSFFCGDAALCGEGGPLRISADGASLTASRKTEAVAAICGDESKKNPPRYCISVSSTGETATSKCAQACGLS